MKHRNHQSLQIYMRFSAPTSHGEVVTSLQAMNHHGQQQMVNLAQQNKINQQLLKQPHEMLNRNKPNQNVVPDVNKSDIKNNDSFGDQLSFADEHLMPLLHTPDHDSQSKEEQTDSVFSPDAILGYLRSCIKNWFDDENDRLVKHYRIEINPDESQTL